MKESLKAKALKHMRYLTLLAIIILIAVFFGSMNPNFLRLSNMTNMIRQTAVLAIVSIGMTGIILTGGIDLSVGSTVALCGMVAAKVILATENVLLAILSSIAVGAIVGCINGFLIGKMELTAFIVTLAMQSATRGLTMYMSNGASVSIDNPIIKYIAQGEVLGIPLVLVFLIAFYALGIWMLDGFNLGQYLYAIGGNTPAARAMGINVTKRIIQIYSISGVLVGVCAIITMGRLGSAQIYAGRNLEFDAITAVVLGGTSLVGGIGTLTGTLLGTIMVGFISNGLSMMSISTFADYFVKGAMILIAVGIDVIFIRMKQKRLTPKIREEKNDLKEEAGIADYCKNEKDLVLKMSNITKAFPGMKALDDVSLTLKKGEIHALMGENGAGKSTLMKILVGEYKKDAGIITVNDKYVNIDSAEKAGELGISIIHQELSLVPELSVWQNIFLGKELMSSIPGIVDTKKMIEESRKLLASIGIEHIDVNRPAKSYSVSEQQMIEIAKVLGTDAWLIVMDEPTSALTEKEKDRLFEIMRGLKSKGVCMVYISHRMQEIYDIADHITILRDGKYVGSSPTSKLTENDIIRMMVGRELNNIFDREKTGYGESVLRVEGMSRSGKFRDVNFEVHAGEVLGFSGLMGAGRTEIMKCLFGLDTKDAGKVYMDGKEVSIKTPEDAINAGIAYVPEDRRAEGFVPFMSIKKNIALPSYGRISKMGKYNKKAEHEMSQKYIDLLKVKTISEDKNVVELSGGNQQKVILGKWMALSPKVLILDEPTRGIDVGAKAEIHHLIAEIARQGVAVILISSELPELLGCADNIIVLREGVITGSFSAKEATQDIIMKSSVQNAAHA